jgi:predicted RNA binding protein with dsRBD fold (UPF0201 family)
VSQLEPKATLILEATVSPSEALERVIAALKGVVGDVEGEIKSEGKSVRLVTKDPKALNRLRDQFRDRHIRSAARRQLLLKRNGRTTNLMLNRQAATAGVVAICGSPDESPLGPIYATFESKSLDEVIDWLSNYSEG